MANREGGNKKELICPCTKTYIQFKLIKGEELTLRCLPRLDKHTEKEKKSPLALKFQGSLTANDIIGNILLYRSSATNPKQVFMQLRSGEWAEIPHSSCGTSMHYVYNTRLTIITIPQRMSFGGMPGQTMAVRTNCATESTCAAS